MSWKLSLLGLVLALVAKPAQQEKQSASSHDLVVEVGDFPMNGQWYHDVYTHVHDEVKILPKYEAKDRVEVTIGSGRVSGTDVTLRFWHDEAGSTHVDVSGMHRRDSVGPGTPGLRHLGDIEGHVLVHTDDWGPGKTLNCLFALRGSVSKKPQLLLGSFSLLMPR